MGCRTALPHNKTSSSLGTMDLPPAATHPHLLCIVVCPAQGAAAMQAAHGRAPSGLPRLRVCLPAFPYRHWSGGWQRAKRGVRLAGHCAASDGHHCFHDVQRTAEGQELVGELL